MVQFTEPGLDALRVGAHRPPPRGPVTVRRPGPIRRAVWWIASWLPPAFFLRIVRPTEGGDSSAFPRVQVPATPVRLFVGPTNAAGQGWAWARAVERFADDVGAQNMAYRRTLAFPADVDARKALRGSRAWQSAQRREVLRFSHVVIEAQESLFPALGRGVAGEVHELRDAGVAVATLCHGSDVRLPSAHAQRDPWSPFLLESYTDTPLLQARAERSHELLRRLHEEGVPAFVSTPDLLLDVPWATWLPVVVDVDRWRTDTAPLERDVPVVVHAPSRAALKGTDLVEPVLRALEREGRVVYRQATGLDRDGMLALYRDADVVVDQLRLGIYGVAACEAMAAGRVVVSHVSQQSRREARKAAGQDLPVVEATADTLRDVLLDVVDGRDRARAVAARGPGFVRVLHDGRASSRALGDFLSSPGGTSVPGGTRRTADVRASSVRRQS
ncbi:hypothetical protein [Cellulosimicrobium protaetiae]|uniref:Uncharacterized protein n=1 Tax=Cellulosimicrobium protaetiae TaxID=2587808 RepID=A0A6M5UG67_9MICO|nr:hypothetical protein [Cellulosimicrobium protaetiae]QJW36088.1 hypothetical protein FIC82_007625 [Cellulosimicrobium protaetiae]